MSNPISLDDYQKLIEIAEELKQIRDKYDLKEIQIEDKKWFSKEQLCINIRAEKPLDYYSSFLILNNMKDNTYSSYESFIHR